MGKRPCPHEPWDDLQGSGDQGKVHPGGHPYGSQLHPCHMNLGLALIDLGQRSEGLTECLIAVSIDHTGTYPVLDGKSIRETGTTRRTSA